MAYHGKNGNVKFTTALVNIGNWSASTSADIDDATAMGDEWAEHLIGHTDFSATAEGKSKKELDTPALIGSTGTLSLVFEGAASTGGPHLSGAAILTSLTETVDHEATATLSYSFEGNSAAGLVYSATGGDLATGVADAFHGKACSANFNGAIANVRGWSVTMSCTTDETTIAGQTGKTRLAGQNTAEATLTCLADGAPQITYGDQQTLNLNRTATPADGYYEGTATCTGAEPGTDKDGVATISFSFQFTGEVQIKTT